MVTFNFFTSTTEQVDHISYKHLFTKGLNIPDMASHRMLLDVGVSQKK
jgi:hypothetical protein